MNATTVSYVAKPKNHRCAWWSVRIPADYDIFRLDDKQSLRPLGFLRNGDDVELEEGEAILDSEARHHRKQRGYVVRIGIVEDGKLNWYSPGAETKSKIKEWSSPDQWATLKNGSGDVAACLRLLLAKRMGFKDY